MPSRKRTKPAAAPVEPEIDETEELDIETDEVEEDDVETEDDDVDDLEVEDAEDEPEPAPKKRAKKAAAADADKPAKAPRETIEFGSAWLAEHVNEQTGSSFNAFGIRTLLRKLVKDGVVQRDVGEDRSRYNFTKGANDPVVKAVIKAIKSGAAEKAKQEKIAEAQAAKAKAAEPKPAAKKAVKAKAKPAPVEDEDDEDEDIEDL